MSPAGRAAARGSSAAATFAGGAQSSFGGSGKLAEAYLWPASAGIGNGPSEDERTSRAVLGRLHRRRFLAFVRFLDGPVLRLKVPDRMVQSFKRPVGGQALARDREGDLAANAHAFLEFEGDVVLEKVPLDAVSSHRAQIGVHLDPCLEIIRYVGL